MRGFAASKLTWLLATSTLSLAASKEHPNQKSKTFENGRIDLTYFDDSDIVVFADQSTGEVWRSEDAGIAWDKVGDISEAVDIQKNPFNSNVAIALGAGTTHHITKDKGKKWSAFKTDTPIYDRGRVISFHGSDPDRILYQGRDCIEEIFCQYPVYYTLDGFSSAPKMLHESVLSCLWAKTTDIFTTGDEELDKDRIMCNVGGDFSLFESESLVVATDDFFKTPGVQPLLEGDRPAVGIINIASVTGYLAAAAKSVGSNELALYVTSDTKTWHRAEFGNHTVHENAYTILESTNYSMQVDVLSRDGKAQMGHLFTSNSNGTFFTRNVDYTNRNSDGYVDFEKVSNIPGIVLVNTVSNHDEVAKSSRQDKEIITKISFDDGRTWHELRADREALHLHSVTDQKNTGRIFSSPAVGLIMGVGNTGDHLKSREKGDTFISDDAGVTWNKTLTGPHMYEMGDSGAILVAIEDGPTNKIKWSLDHGQNWKETELEVDSKIVAQSLTTTPDSTSLKFVLTVKDHKHDKPSDSTTIIGLDFADLHERECKKDDFEDWSARLDDDGKPSCLMGAAITYKRRKADAGCFVNSDFRDPEPQFEQCVCKDYDYECDFGFVKKGDKCEPDGLLKAPADACQGDEETYMGSSGYRLIPGNKCKSTGGTDLDTPVERPCSGTTSAPASGSVNSTVTIQTFKREKSFDEVYYLERCEKCQGDDETVVARTSVGTVFITYDHGKVWQKVPDIKDEVIGIDINPYFTDQVYFKTKKKRVYYSRNRGQTIHHFDTPEESDIRLPLSFHPKQADWLIWTGIEDHQTRSHVSFRNGDGWDPLMRAVRKCEFVYSDLRPNSTDLVYCEAFDNEDKTANTTLWSSLDFFKSKEALKTNVVNFATMSEYIVVALKDESDSLKVDASIDGRTFADARFPPKFEVEHQRAYTVLDSSTHSIFLHVTVNAKPDSEYGSIIKSNSNGTDYVLAINNVNRDRNGYVDFEKIQGLEGVSVVNVVANIADVSNGEKKKLKTMVSHNDGAEFATILRPDSRDFSVDWCNGDREVCSLHLHGYTERTDPRRTMSSPTATGLLIAHGNVGEFLGDLKDVNTFMSTDGGIQWSMIAEGRWTFAFGDRGSIVVIAQKGKATKTIKYSLDEGKTWQDYQFSDDEMEIEFLSTVPSDTSRMVMLWGKIDKDLATVNVDFSGLKERSKKCSLDEKNPESNDDDYYLWTPEHPLSRGDCLFGHKSRYHRKQIDSKCYNGKVLPSLHSIDETCQCTRSDYECAYNFEPQVDGTCSLVAGHSPIDPAEVCKVDGIKEYYGPSAYRKLAMSTCSGGTEYEKTQTLHACPGYQLPSRISAAGLFFAITIPIAVAAAAGWYVWRNWDGKFGSIRLGDGSTGSRIGLGGVLDGDAPYIKYPVLALSAAVTVVLAIPMILSTVWKTIRTRFDRRGGRFGSSRTYTSRASFRGGRGNYSVIEDEGELLGDDSEDEER